MRVRQFEPLTIEQQQEIQDRFNILRPYIEKLIYRFGITGEDREDARAAALRYMVKMYSNSRCRKWPYLRQRLNIAMRAMVYSRNNTRKKQLDTVSLEMPVGDGAFLYEILPDTREDSTDDQIRFEANLRLAVSMLPPKKYDIEGIMVDRIIYGLNYRDIAKKYGFTVQWAHELVKRTLAWMVKKIPSKDVNWY